MRKKISMEKKKLCGPEEGKKEQGVFRYNGRESFPWSQRALGWLFGAQKNQKQILYHQQMKLISKSDGKDLIWKATILRVQIFLKNVYIFVLSHSALKMFFSSRAYKFLLGLWNIWFWKLQLQIYKKPFHIYEAHNFKFVSGSPSKHWPTWKTDRRNIQPH